MKAAHTMIHVHTHTYIYIIIYTYICTSIICKYAICVHSRPKGAMLCLPAGNRRSKQLWVADGGRSTIRIHHPVCFLRSPDAAMMDTASMGVMVPSDGAKAFCCMTLPRHAKAPCKGTAGRATHAGPTGKWRGESRFTRADLHSSSDDT